MHTRKFMMPEPKIITTDDEYQASLAEVELLATHDPAPETAAGIRLVLLAAQVEHYEKVRFPLR